MKNILVDDERELNVRSNMIYNMTKEVVENDTDANKRLFFWLCHETWMLKKFPKFLTSKKAYEMFYAMYKQDIRDFGWADSKVEKCKNSNKKRQFMHEHLTTTNDFKNELVYLYKKGLLTVDKVKDLILQQRICWITREEDDILTHTKTYKDHRPNPLLAYKECGIEIYECEKADLSNIMIPTFDIAKSIKSIDNTLSHYDVEDSSINLLEKIKNKIMLTFDNYNVHYSMSYIQIWKNTWNNQGKRGVHYELSPQKSKGFAKISGCENFYITFKLHNEDNTCNIIPQIPKSKVYFRKEYSFLNKDLEKSINILLNDIKKIIDIDETNIDVAHNTLELN